MALRRSALASADRRELAAAVATALRAGELCVLPTETVYGLTLLPSSKAALERARALKGRAEGHEFTFHLAAAADADRLASTADPRARRLMARYWPGPMTLVLPAHAATTATVGLRVPAHDFTRAAIAAAGEPLWMTSVNRTGSPPLTDPEAIAAAFAAQLAILVDDGPSPLGTASTVVRITGKDVEVLREGILGRDDILATAAATVLFVCTGNTCRSPMAEALARKAMARAVGVPVEALLARGLAFRSAGTGTNDGMPASEGSVAAALEVGLDLTAHQSTQLTPELCTRADRILCLSSSHRHTLLDAMPELDAKVELLRPDGQGIADPYGGDLADYRRARDEIAAAIEQRLAGFGALLPAR